MLGVDAEGTLGHWRHRLLFPSTNDSEANRRTPLISTTANVRIYDYEGSSADEKWAGEGEERENTVGLAAEISTRHFNCLLTEKEGTCVVARAKPHWKLPWPPLVFHLAGNSLSDLLHLSIYDLLQSETCFFEVIGRLYNLQNTVNCANFNIQTCAKRLGSNEVSIVLPNWLTDKFIFEGRKCHLKITSLHFCLCRLNAASSTTK